MTEMQRCPYCKKEYNKNGIGRHIVQCKLKHGIKNWHNLKENKCPECGADWLKPGKAKFGFRVITCACGFSISEEKMTDIVNKLIRGTFTAPE